VQIDTNEEGKEYKFKSYMYGNDFEHLVISECENENENQFLYKYNYINH